MIQKIAEWYFNWGYIVFTFIGVIAGYLIARIKNQSRNMLIAVLIYVIFAALLLFYK